MLCGLPGVQSIRATRHRVVVIRDRLLDRGDGVPVDCRRRGDPVNPERCLRPVRDVEQSKTVNRRIARAEVLRSWDDDPIAVGGDS